MGEEINTMVQISYSRDTVAYFVYRLNISLSGKCYIDVEPHMQ